MPQKKRWVYFVYLCVYPQLHYWLESMQSQIHVICIRGQSHQHTPYISISKSHCVDIIRLLYMNLVTDNLIKSCFLHVYYIGHKSFLKNKFLHLQKATDYLFWMRNSCCVYTITQGELCVVNVKTRLIRNF